MVMSNETSVDLLRYYWELLCGREAGDGGLLNQWGTSSQTEEVVDIV